MSDSTIKQIGITVGAGLLVYALWEGWLKKAFFTSATGSAIDSATGGADSASSDASGGAGGFGSGGAGGSGGGDYAALAAAIAALAAGVALPNIKSVSMTVASGTTELVPALGGKRVCVLAYVVSAAGTVYTAWRDGSASADLWRVSLDSPAGNSGANLSTSWPGYLFATSGGNALNVATNGAAVVAVTYWLEDV